MNPVVEFAIDDGVARITLNRPHCGNAINAEMAFLLLDAMQQAIAAKPRVLVIQARGSKFCVGGDIEQFVRQRGRLDLYVAGLVNDLHGAMLRLASLSCPTLAVVQGALGGAGVPLALFADVVLSSSAVKMRTGYVGIGLTPDLGASYFLEARAGAAAARRLLLTNQELTAEQASNAGLFDEVVPHEQLLSHGNRWISTLASLPPQAYARIKRLCDLQYLNQLKVRLDEEASCLIEAARGVEVQEGITAFLEKRAPRFPSILTGGDE